MSKQSKNLQTHAYFHFQFKARSKSRNNIPSSIEKLRPFLEKFHQTSPNNKKQKKPSNQFYLSYRDPRIKHDLIGFYRKKYLMHKITQITADSLSQLQIIGTFDKKIIVAFSSRLSVFCFIDQHAIHERIRYQFYIDRLKCCKDEAKHLKNWSFDSIQKDNKDISVISKIRHSYIACIMPKQFDLNMKTDRTVSMYGFKVSYEKETRMLKVNTISDILERSLSNEMIMGISQEIILGTKHLPKCLQQLIAEISCKSAYKFNDVLTEQTIQQLLQNLALCQYPFFCVHGRPTLFTKP